MKTRLYVNKGKYVLPKYWRFSILENQMVKYIWFMCFLLVTDKI